MTTYPEPEDAGTVDAAGVLTFAEGGNSVKKKSHKISWFQNELVSLLVSNKTNNSQSFAQPTHLPLPCRSCTCLSIHKIFKLKISENL